MERKMIGKMLLAAGLATLASTATFSQAMPGSPQEQSACRPDTRRFCTHIKPEMGPFAYLACLQSNRAKLSKACLAVLASNGQ
jgi:hypothetical protein